MSDAAAMYIVFEGIDGSGKTTLSTRLAAVLRGQGLGVFHTREGGQYASDVAQAIRELGRDPRMLDLCATGEMMLGMAREAQVMHESVRPALARGAHVITDRSVYSWMALAADGRGLSPEQARGCAEAATGGLWPDLVIVCDVDLRTSRRRKRVQKVADHRVGQTSRKGLSGLALREKQREGLLRMAREHPSSWVVVDNARGGIEESLAAILRAVGARLGKELPPPAPPAARPAEPELAAEVVRGRDARGLVAETFRMIERAAGRDPGFAAFLLAGFDDPRADALREQLAAGQPALVAWGIRGAVSPASIDLRRRLMAGDADYVLRGLAGVDAEWAWDLRERGWDDAPGAVLGSLRGLASERAFALRRRAGKKQRADLLASVARLDLPEAWEIRRKHGKKDPLALGKSLLGMDGEDAWRMRDDRLADFPLGLLPSVAGLAGERAMELRRRYLERAPRLVLGTLRTVATDAAYQVRERLAHMGKELLDSIHALADARAWRIRREHAEAWPHTAIRSLGSRLAQQTAEGADLLWALLARDPRDLHAAKVAALVLTRPVVEGEDDDAGGDVDISLPS